MATPFDKLGQLAGFTTALLGSSSTSKTSSSGGTRSTQLQVDQAGIDRMVQNMLRGQGGQASISGAARGAGIYNSTTERQLLDNLNATVAGEIASRTGKTVEETSPMESTTISETPGLGLKGLALPAAMMLGKPVIERALGLISGPTEAQVASAWDMVNQSPDPIGSLIGAATGDVLQGSMGMINASADPIGSLIGELTGGTGVADLSANFGSLGNFGMSQGMMGLPALGPIGSALFSGLDDNFGMSLGLAGLAPALALSPVTAVAAPLLGLMKGISSASVVCTALRELGLLDAEQYKAGASYLASLHPRVVAGYYTWGLGLAQKVREKRVWAISLSLPVAASRTALLASPGSFWDHLRFPLGTITKFIGEPACYVIGFIKEKCNGLGFGSRTR